MPTPHCVPLVKTRRMNYILRIGGRSGVTPGTSHQPDRLDRLDGRRIWTVSGGDPLSRARMKLCQSPLADGLHGRVDRTPRTSRPHPMDESTAPHRQINRTPWASRPYIMDGWTAPHGQICSASAYFLAAETGKGMPPLFF